MSAMRRAWLVLVGTGTFCWGAPCQSAPLERFTIDLAGGIAVMAMSQQYETLLRTTAGGQSAARFQLRCRFCSAATVNIDATFRVRPRLGFGVEGSGEFELDAPSYDWSNAVGLKFDRRRFYALSGIVEVNLQMTDFGPRHGWFVRGGGGVHWIDGRVTGDSQVLGMHRETGGLQAFGSLGYRWTMLARTSILIQVTWMAQTDGLQAGLLVGGGFQ